MSHTETSDPAAIERDIDRTRARLDTRLSELASRLSPGQIVDETLGMLRTREGADFARNLGEAVREKPIPAALAGIGIAWLMAGPRDHARDPWTDRTRLHGARPLDQEPDLMTRAWNAGRDIVRGTGETDAEYRVRMTEARGTVLGLTRNAQETAESFADRVQEALFAARDRVSDAASSAGAAMRDAAGQMAGKTADTLGAMGTRAGYAAQGMTDTLRARAHDVRDAASSLGASAAGQAQHWMPDTRSLPDGGSLAGFARAMGDNPALLGALGMAAGALLGALMPVTEFEREHLGEATRAFRSALAETARTATERGADVARAAVDAGRETVREAGAQARDVASQATEAARQVGETAQRHAQEVAAKAQEHAGAVTEQAASAARDAGTTATTRR